MLPAWQVWHLQNAFLGVNHSMAHKLGAFHHLPHGVANAVILTEVMRYNAAEVPTKMGTFSQYPVSACSGKIRGAGKICRMHRQYR